LEEEKMDDAVTLVDEQDGIFVHIDARITEEGNLVISGQDLGQELVELFGDSEYEYFLSIKAPHKDRLLLVLIEKVYKGNSQVITEIQELLESKSIPCELFTC
jgi:hypothetical protein